MGKLQNDLYLFEALELRNSYDRMLNLLKSILDTADSGRDVFSVRSESDQKEFDDAFDFRAMENARKSLETKRVKLNQAIQTANFTNMLQHRGADIPIAEALEIRKTLLSEIDALSSRVRKSAFKEIVHKEERDIVHRPKYRFPETYNDYHDKVHELRTLNGEIHRMNHITKVNFKDEE